MPAWLEFTLQCTDYASPPRAADFTCTSKRYKRNDRSGVGSPAVPVPPCCKEIPPQQCEKLMKSHRKRLLLNVITDHGVSVVRHTTASSPVTNFLFHMTVGSGAPSEERHETVISSCEVEVTKTPLGTNDK